MSDEEKQDMSDEEKHALALKRTGMYALFLLPALYDAAQRAGYDMNCFVKQQPITTR